ncbi:MAG: ribosome maturation factor RimM [Gammaproteobacteria bacterium]|nr:ribosome maturation factor RimM [Gammaproteobacteria bacterium]
MKLAGFEDKMVILGRINGLYGVRGWLKIYSYSRPKENIFAYSPWQIKFASKDWRECRVKAWKTQGKGLIAEFEGVTDREIASQYLGLELAVTRSAMPALADDEYYWCDLIGLEVLNQNNLVLGKITEIKETGANDVLVVEGQTRYLVPVLKGSVIKAVDLNEGKMLVDWDGEYI